MSAAAEEYIKKKSSPLPSLKAWRFHAPSAFGAKTRRKLASFAGGPALGVAAARWAAPGSELAQLVSPLAFALAFAGGLMLWFGIGVVAVVGSALQRLVRGRWHRRRRLPSATVFVPPGYGAFLPLAVGFGLLAGAIAGLVPQSPSFWLS